MAQFRHVYDRIEPAQIFDRDVTDVLDDGERSDRVGAAGERARAQPTGLVVAGVQAHDVVALRH